MKTCGIRCGRCKAWWRWCTAPRALTRSGRWRTGAHWPSGSTTPVLAWPCRMAARLKQQAAQDIAQGLAHAQVWPAMPLDALTDALATCAGVIGVDSGLSHIAVALDLPHVQIYNFDTAWRTGPLPPPNPELRRAPVQRVCPAHTLRSMPSGRPGWACWPTRQTHDALALLLPDVAGAAAAQAQVAAPQPAGAGLRASHGRALWPLRTIRCQRTLAPRSGFMRCPG